MNVTEHESENPAPPGFFGPGDSRDHSLVKGCISPTPAKRPIPRGTPGAYGIIEYRDWQNTWRIRTSVQTSRAGSLQPPEGERVSECLSDRAARALADSCEYVGRCKGGYRTFMTLTFDEQHRAAIAAGEETIQENVSRFFDGLQRMWQRGWLAQFDQHGMRFYQAGRDGLVEGEEAHSGDLLYCWVIENPKNADGEDNPHVHLMLNWRVKYRLFPAWARRIETLWGCGFAHIEKIRDAHAAGGYLLKALGYMAKSQDNNTQGIVTGNRYNMSRGARAPGWCRIHVGDMHLLGLLIADVNQHVTEKYGDRYRARRNLKKSLDSIPKKKRGLRQVIGRRLERARKACDAIPIVASQYQIICKTADAYRDLRQWFEAQHHWPGSAVPWLPEKPPGQAWKSTGCPPTREAAEYREERESVLWRRACRSSKRIRWSDDEWAARQDEYLYTADVLLNSEKEKIAHVTFYTDYYPEDAQL